MLKNQKAFSLVELLVTVCVLAILIALALPRFNKQVLNNRSVALGEDIITVFNLARYEAVRRAARVTICASSDRATCTGSWTDGYIVFVDAATSDDAASPDLGGTPVIIKSVGKAASEALVEVKRGGTSVSFVRYTSLGSLARIANSTDSIVINSKMDGCTAVGKARQITIGLSGLVSVRKTNCR
jgi:type IV fimbrial biogenesis protein FimT